MSRPSLQLAIYAALLSLAPCSARADFPLPTPIEHYESFNPHEEALQLLNNVMSELDPSTQTMVLKMLDSSGPQGKPRISKTEAMWVLQSFDWKKWRPQILELLLHHSNILDIVPPKSKDWIPIVHDSLLFFLNRLPEEQLVGRLLNFAYLPPDSDRGERILQFVSKTPAFQKIGQILARNPNIPVDVREALQVLENSLQTTNRDELVNWIAQEIGSQTIEKYQIQFSEKILAEGSVGAVIRATLVLPGETDREEAVCKIIKPYVLRALPEELSIINELTLYFGAHREFYEIEAIPLEEMFRDLSEALSKEIQIDEEQRNLVRARAYYQGNRRILVQKLYPFSTEHSSFMEFVEGEKISDAFTGDSRRRAKLARRLSDALTFDVIFFRSGGGPLSR